MQNEASSPKYVQGIKKLLKGEKNSSSNRDLENKFRKLTRPFPKSSEHAVQSVGFPLKNTRPWAGLTMRMDSDPHA